MANQLRAAFYLLGRNYRTWVALVLVALDRAYIAWGVTRGVTYGLQDSLFRDKTLVAIVLFAAASVAAFDQRGGALRAACGAEKGRTGYVVSRFVAVVVVTLGLLAAAAVLDVIAGLVVPGASVIAASPAMCAPERVLAGVLTYLVIAGVGFAAGLVTRSQSAIATAGIVVVAYVVFSMLVLIALPQGAVTQAEAALYDVVGFALPLEGLTADVMFAPSAALMPLDSLRAFVVPLVWLVALLVLGLALMARRTV